MVGDFLSYDPYGIMFRKDDPQLARAGAATRSTSLPKTARSSASTSAGSCAGCLRATSLDLPMSPQLETLVRAMAAKPE